MQAFALSHHTEFQATSAPTHWTPSNPLGPPPTHWPTLPPTQPPTHPQLALRRIDEFHGLSPFAKFVHPAAALKLQELWDGGNKLVSLLDDK